MVIDKSHLAGQRLLGADGLIKETEESREDSGGKSGVKSDKGYSGGGDHSDTQGNGGGDKSKQRTGGSGPFAGPPPGTKTSIVSKSKADAKAKEQAKKSPVKPPVKKEQPPKAKAKKGK